MVILSWSLSIVSYTDRTYNFGAETHLCGVEITSGLFLVGRLVSSTLTIARTLSWATFTKSPQRFWSTTLHSCGHCHSWMIICAKTHTCCADIDWALSSCDMCINWNKQLALPLGSTGLPVMRLPLDCNGEFSWLNSPIIIKNGEKKTNCMADSNPV